MTTDQFWEIIDRVDDASGGDMDRKCALLGEYLGRLPAEEVQSFSEHFDEAMDQAYSWDLWAAAYIIGGGCSDDAFSDFRATLISRGREEFERALTNPESLAESDIDEETGFHEGYQYVVDEVHEKLTGKATIRTKPHPESPSGVEFDEETVGERYPGLAGKHGY
jgi:hypothetical protein